MEPNKEIPAVGKKVVVETYAEDMAKVIESDKGGGLIKKLIHGEEEHEKEKMAASPEVKKNKLFIIASVVLTILTLVILSFFLSDKEAPTVPVEKQFVPIVFHDASVFKEVAGFNQDQIVQTVVSAAGGTEIKKGGVVGIYLTNNKKILGLREFIALTKSNFAPNNNPVLVSDNFLLGVVNSETKDFFIILKMRSLADIFDSLRSWEAKMFNDLHGFFGVDITPETKYLLTKEFENGILENKNARILRDNDGKIVMMYVLADENSIVITGTEAATRELVLRLGASQVKK